MDQYLAALLSHDGSKLKISSNVKITEDTKPSDFKTSHLWTTAQKIGPYKFSFQQGDQYGWCGLIYRSDGYGIVSLRIRINEQGEITESETLIGAERYPGKTATDPATLKEFRADFTTIIPKGEQHTKGELISIANSYYNGVTYECPESVPLNPAGSRVEMGTQISSNEGYDMTEAFYVRVADSQDTSPLPNFGAWSAKDQFLSGLWGSDIVNQVRFPIVDIKRGLVCGYSMYNPMAKKRPINVKGVGDIELTILGPDSQSIAMMEIFKIKKGEIYDMETVWVAVPRGDTTGWPEY